MRITIGSTLLGDVDAEIAIGGFEASVGGDRVQRGSGGCDALSRVRLHGSFTGNFSIPTKRLFDSVPEAEKWAVDTIKVGGYEGLLLCAYADGSDTKFDWATAIPTSITYRGVTVTAVWNVTAGTRLT